MVLIEAPLNEAKAMDNSSGEVTAKRSADPIPIRCKAQRKERWSWVNIPKPLELPIYIYIYAGFSYRYTQLSLKIGKGMGRVLFLFLYMDTCCPRFEYFGDEIYSEFLNIWGIWSFQHGKSHSVNRSFLLLLGQTLLFNWSFSCTFQKDLDS